jgi:cell wall-associated NlpC family hydrolase
MRRLVFVLVFFLVACGSTPKRDVRPAVFNPQGMEVSLFAMGLLDVGYQFGGNNPEAGLDCSGMVRYVYKNAIGLDLPHNAAEIAKRAKPIADRDLRAGDLVFFNTLGYSFSHVGIYIGDGRFIHAPSSKGRVRIVPLSNPYFAARYLGARTLLD